MEENMVPEIMGFTGGASLNEPTCQYRKHKRREFNPWVKKIPWRRAWQPTLVFLPGESHGQRSLASYSPLGHKELDMPEVTEHSIALKLTTTLTTTTTNCYLTHAVCSNNPQALE